MKMKIFHLGESTGTVGLLEKKVNDWLQGEHPLVVSSSQSVVFGENGVVKYILLTVFYK